MNVVVLYKNAFKLCISFPSMSRSEDMLKRAFVAGAGSAMNYKDKHPNASESEVMGHVARESRRILEEIQETE